MIGVLLFIVSPIVLQVFRQFGIKKTKLSQSQSAIIRPMLLEIEVVIRSSSRRPLVSGRNRICFVIGSSVVGLAQLPYGLSIGSWKQLKTGPCHPLFG